MTTLDLGRETRSTSGIELRRVDQSAGEPFAEFRGYATVFDVPYDVAGGPAEGGWTEIVKRGAFARDLGRVTNRALLHQHDNARVLATTRAGTLTIEEDNVGLLVTARLDTRVGWIADVVQQIETGVIDEMSIGFIDRSGRGAWSKDFMTRTVSAAQLIEATTTWAGANGATVGAIDRARSIVAEARTASEAHNIDRARIAAAVTLALN